MVKIIAIIAVALCFPAFMFSYGWGLLQVMKVAPWWVSVPVTGAHLTCWIGIERLIARRE